MDRRIYKDLIHFLYIHIQGLGYLVAHPTNRKWVTTLVLNGIFVGAMSTYNWGYNSYNPLPKWDGPPELCVANSWDIDPLHSPIFQVGKAKQKPKIQLQVWVSETQWVTKTPMTNTEENTNTGFYGQFGSIWSKK